MSSVDFCRQTPHIWNGRMLCQRLGPIRSGSGFLLNGKIRLEGRDGLA